MQTVASGNDFLHLGLEVVPKPPRLVAELLEKINSANGYVSKTQMNAYEFLHPYGKYWHLVFMTFVQID